MRETRKAKLAKEAYLAMGPERSLQKLCDAMGKGTGYLRRVKEWSRVHNWAMDAEAQDLEEARTYAASQLRRRDEAREERLKITRGLRIAGQNILAGLLAAMKDTPEGEELARLGLPRLLHHLPTATRALEAAFREERLDLGEAVTRTELTGPGGGPMEVGSRPDLSAYTDAELEELRAIHERANGRRQRTHAGRDQGGAGPEET